MLTKLQKGLAFYNIETTSQQQNQLCEFLYALKKWNKIHNLTAIKSIDEMVTKHVLDSVSISKFITSGKIIDVGTGAGLPGIPLAIVKPDLQFTLLDSNKKKISFIQHVITTLDIANVEAVHSRVEDYKPEEEFNIVVSRAFAETGGFVSSSSHLCHKDGFFMAMKGKFHKAQTESLPDGYIFTKIESVVVPGEEGERCIVFIKREKRQI